MTHFLVLLILIIGLSQDLSYMVLWNITWSITNLQWEREEKKKKKERKRHGLSQSLEVANQLGWTSMGSVIALASL
jgi:hypothetical protein